MQTLRFTTLLVFLIVASFTSQASLILNGSFEQNRLSQHNWSVFHSNQVQGWQGSNIEIWHQLNNVSAADGLQHAELNAHGHNVGDWSIFQPFATVAGLRYDLSFAYRARASENEAFRVSVADFSQIIDDHKTTHWSWFKTTFIATEPTTTLRFTSLNTGTVGNFLDDVRVLASPTSQAVSSGPMFPILLAAFAVLWLRRRHH